MAMKKFALLSMLVGAFLLVNAGTVFAAGGDEPNGTHDRVGQHDFDQENQSGDDAENARVPLFYAGQNPSTCPSYAPSGSPVSGFVNAHQVGGTLTVNVHVRNAAPNATLVVNVRCQTARIGFITTNSNGVGNGTFQTNARIGTFAIDAFNIAAFSGGQPSQVFISAPITLK